MSGKGEKMPSDGTCGEAVVSVEGFDAQRRSTLSSTGLSRKAPAQQQGGQSQSAQRSVRIPVGRSSVCTRCASSKDVPRVLSSSPPHLSVSTLCLCTVCSFL